MDAKAAKRPRTENTADDPLLRRLDEALADQEKARTIIEQAKQQEAEAKERELKAREDIRATGAIEPDSLFVLANDQLSYVLEFLTLYDLSKRVVSLCSRFKAFCCNIYDDMSAAERFGSSSCAGSAAQRLIRYKCAETFAEREEKVERDRERGSWSAISSFYPAEHYETFVRLSFNGLLIWQGFVERQPLPLYRSDERQRTLVLPDGFRSVPWPEMSSLLAGDEEREIIKTRATELFNKSTFTIIALHKKYGTMNLWYVTGNVNEVMRPRELEAGSDHFCFVNVHTRQPNRYGGIAVLEIRKNGLQLLITPFA